MNRSIPERVALQTGRCLNNRGHAGFCRRCLNACEAHAIDISDAGIRMDGCRCSGCLACLSACPTDVFSLEEFSPLDLVDRIKGEREVQLHCERCDADTGTAGVASIPCHGLLDERLLIAMHGHGLKQLNLYGLERCGRCPSGESVRLLLRTVDTTPSDLKRRFPSLRDMSGSAATPLSATMDRRTFLDGALSTVTRTVIDRVAPPSAEQTPKTSEVSERTSCEVKHVPQSHRLALIGLASGAISPGDVLWFHEVRMHGSCDACGICSLTCPTGALVTEADDKTNRLNHRPGACIGCGLCTAFCPGQALRLSRADSDSGISTDAVHLLSESEIRTCTACGETFTDTGRRNRLCRSCENENAIHGQWLGS